MAAPGAITNTVSASTSSATSLSATGMGTGTNDRIAIIGIIGDKSGSLAVDTAGWTLLGTTVGSSMTIGYAYKAGATDTAVQFSWTTAASAAMWAGQSPDTDFSGTAPAINTNAAATSTGSSSITMPSVAWTPTATDVRIVSVAVADDGRKVWDTWPDTDNNVAVTAGGSGAADLGIASQGYTASSPQSPGTFSHANPVTNNVAQGLVLKEHVGIPITPAAVTVTVTAGTLTVIEDQPVTPAALTVTATAGTLTITGGLLDITPAALTVTVTAGSLTVAGATGNNQASFRIRDDTAALNTDSGWYATENSNASVPAEQVFRIRFEIGALTATNVGYKLQYNRSGAGWTDVAVEADPLAQAILPVTVASAPSSQFTDGAATTNLLTTETGTFVAGTGDAASNSVAAVNLAANEHTELEFALLIHKFYDTGSDVAHNADGTTFQFRVVESGGSALNQYGNTPTVTVASPNLLGGTHPESSVDIGPIGDTNGNLYYVTESWESTTRKRFIMLKSTDGGVTWAPVDMTNGPTAGNQSDVEALSLVPDVSTTGVLHVGHSHGGTIWYHRFHMSDHATTPDDWNTTNTTVATITAPNHIDGTSLVQRSDGDLIMFYGLDDGAFDAINYKISTDGGSVWGSANDLDGTASEDHRFPWAVLGENDTTHIFYIGDTGGSDTASIHHKTLTSGDVLTADGSRDTIYGSDLQNGNPEKNPLFGAVYYDDDGVEVVTVGYLKKTGAAGGERFIWSRAMRDGTLQTAKQISDGTRDVAFGLGGSGSASATMVGEDGTKRLHVLYREELVALEGAGIWYDTETDEGGWGTDVQKHTDPGINSGWVKATVHTRNNNTYLGYVYDKGTASTGGGQGPIYYDEILLVQGLIPAATTVTATAGTVTVELSAGTQNITPAATTVTATAGTLTLAVDVPVTAPTVTATAGTLTLTVDVPLTGPTVTATAGTLTITTGAVDITPAATTVTATPGTVTLTVDVPVTGPTVTATPGTLTLAVDVPVTGPTVTATAGTVTVAAGAVDITPDPVTVTATPGTVTLAVDVPLTAPTVTVTAGTLTLAVDVPLTGQTVTATPGTLDVAVSGGTQNITPTATTITATPGTLTLTVDVPLTAPTVTATPGTLTLAVDVPLTAPTVTATAGTLTVVATQSIIPAASTVTVTPGTVSLIAAPTVSSSTTGSHGAQTQPQLSLPAGTGDKIFIHAVDWKKTDYAITSSGWTLELTQIGASGPTIAVGYKADTSDTTVDISYSGAEPGTYWSGIVTGSDFGASDIESASAEASSGTPDPPNLDPSWTSTGTLVIAAVGHDDCTKTITAYPYDDANKAYINDSNADSAGTAVDFTTTNGGAEDPGTFTLSTADNWCSVNVAIKAASSSGQITLTGPTVTATAGTLTITTGAVDITPAATTITTTPGTLTLAVDVPLTAPTVTVTAGTVTVDLDIPVTGPTVTVTPAALTVSLDTGQAVTPAATTVTATPGTVTLAIDVPLTGPTVTVTAGTVTIGIDVPLTGPTVTATPQTLTVTVGAVDITPDPVTVTATAGTVTLTVDVPLTGPTVTATAGTVIVAAGTVDITPDVVTINATPGTVTVTGGEQPDWVVIEHGVTATFATESQVTRTSGATSTPTVTIGAEHG